jgi:hypothetical protein
MKKTGREPAIADATVKKPYSKPEAKVVSARAFDKI